MLLRLVTNETKKQTTKNKAIESKPQIVLNTKIISNKKQQPIAGKV